ncbi:uncharacterized protein LOC105703252 [Orussus abietinus]|uniref:uncharacterized protein LOC105703252 n=1 Tax=Orussus abietinus TaxID=222816 RepID=UPI0006260DCA|nr:uncharacterized protein LOC105703252 [Orussus abietinus]
MATPLTNRLWENRNSTNSIISRLAHNELTPAWMSKDKEPLNWIRKGKNKSVSRATTLATPKCRDDFCLKSEPTTVKRSALLYEITERTNQLAKPKLHPNDFRDADKLQIAKIRTYKANDRIIDLAKPKALYAVPTKPIGQVAPSALRAVGWYCRVKD